MVKAIQADEVVIQDLRVHREQVVVVVALL
jgi:hypothetical protein